MTTTKVTTAELLPGDVIAESGVPDLVVDTVEPLDNEFVAVHGHHPTTAETDSYITDAISTTWIVL